MHLLSSAYLVSAGMIVIIGGYSWFLARLSSFRVAGIYFVLLNTLFAGFQGSAGMQYQAATLESALLYHKWLNFFQMMIFGVCALFLDQMVRPVRRSALSLMLFALGVLGCYLNWNTHYGYRFSSVTSEEPVTILGQSSFILSGTPSLASMIQLPMFLLLMFKLYQALTMVRHRRKAGTVSSALLWCGAIHMLVCVGTARLSDYGLIQFPYLAGFGFVLLSFSFAFLIREDLSHHARARLYRKIRQRRRGGADARRWGIKLATESYDVQYAEALLAAIGSQQFELFYQPQVSALDGRPSGFEALIRWNHPTRGMISPTEFIPIAEASGVIHELGLWIIERACKEFSGIRSVYGEDTRLAINVSARQLTSGRVEEQLLLSLHAHGLPASCVELEITETAAIEIPKEVHARLHRLKSLGVRLAIDDFGTGYSSLSYLHKLPVHVVKLDKSFVADIKEGDGKAFAICKSAINLARELGLEVVAEGVETKEQSSILAELGCDFLQGYLYSKPVPAILLPGYLKPASLAMT